MAEIQSSAFARPAVPEAVRTAQAVFRSVMMAMAQPGSIRRIPVPAQGPGGLAPAAAAIALALCDFETPVWLDDVLSRDEAVTRYLRFYTGCPIVAQPNEGHFAFVSSGRALPPLDGFAPGSLEYPDRSTTLVVPVASLLDGDGWRLTGPGIDGSARLAVSDVPDDLPAQLSANRALFPRGVDLILVAGDRVAALPRTTIVEA